MEEKDRLKEEFYDCWYDLTAGEESQRKLLFFAAGILLCLFLLTAHFLVEALEADDLSVDAFIAGVFLAFMFTGFPVILCPLAANAMILFWRTDRFLYILNNIVSVMGILLFGFEIIVIRDGLITNLHSPRADSFSYYAAITATILHCLSLAFGIFFKKITEL